MKYTKYFSSTIKANGVPHLNRHQLQRFMNIVVAETRIVAIESLGINGSHVFQKITKNKGVIERLSKGKTPEQLLKEMVELSMQD